MPLTTREESDVRELLRVRALERQLRVKRQELAAVTRQPAAIRAEVADLERQLDEAAAGGG